MTIFLWVNFLGISQGRRWKGGNALRMTGYGALLFGEDQLLLKIVDFVAGAGTEEAHSVLRVWRALSRADQQFSDSASRQPSVADHIVLRFKPVNAASAKLDFYTRTLKVQLKKLTSSARAPKRKSTGITSGAERVQA